MGAEDMARQALNVFRMRVLGATVERVDAGSRTLKDAINEAMRDWVSNVESTYYLLGSVLGPHPYPLMVREFQSVIGQEARLQIQAAAGRLPDLVVACVGGGSNAIGIVRCVRRRRGRATGRRRSRRPRPSRPVITPLASPAAPPACCTALAACSCRTTHGNILPTHSVSAGLDYPSVGPEHAWLASRGRTRVRVDRRRRGAGGIRVARGARGDPAGARIGARDRVAARRLARSASRSGHSRQSLGPRRQRRRHACGSLREQHR